jgi:hypothetical protein
MQSVRGVQVADTVPDSALQECAARRPPAAREREARTGRADFVKSSRNIHMMHVLARVAARFNEAGIPLLALKGAALNLTLYERPDERPMGDLDLLIRAEHVDAAFALLEELGCFRREPLVREDFFPRFYYEVEYVAGNIYPVKLDLHVRPFRPLRYARLVPGDALWERAEPVRMGQATVLVPAVDDMLIHLAAHSAIHGNARPLWLQDLKRWADARRARIDWNRFLDTVQSWGLALPVREALRVAERKYGQFCPPEVLRRLAQARVGWRDWLALYEAPRDAAHPVAHVAVNMLCTPGWRFTLGYLLAVLLPDRGHMGEWYCRRHWGWLPWAHLLRWLSPLTRRVPRIWSWFTKIETRESAIHGVGVFATQEIRAGEVIARYRGRRVERDGLYVVPHSGPGGDRQRYEITGKLKYLNHSCRPNAELTGFKLVALRPIRAKQEVTIDYGEGACDCRRHRRDTQDDPTDETLASVA